MNIVILLLGLLCGWSLSYGGWGGGLFAGVFALLLAIAVRQDLRATYRRRRRSWTRRT